MLITVADVAGKSIPAALLMATIQASLRTLAASPSTLPELVCGINRHACGNSMGGSRFTTAFFAEVDLGGDKLISVSAGHNPPALLRVSGEIARLDTGGLPLGIRRDGVYESGDTAPSPGDVLLIITDGVVEAEDEDGQDYGEARLLAELNSVPHTSAAEILKRIMSSVDAFAGATRQSDDITCLVMVAAPIARERSDRLESSRSARRRRRLEARAERSQAASKEQLQTQLQDSRQVRAARMQETLIQATGIAGRVVRSAVATDSAVYTVPLGVVEHIERLGPTRSTLTQ